MPDASTVGGSQAFTVRRCKRALRWLQVPASERELLETPFPHRHAPAPGPDPRLQSAVTMCLGGLSTPPCAWVASLHLRCAHFHENCKEGCPQHLSLGGTRDLGSELRTTRETDERALEAPEMPLGDCAACPPKAPSPPPGGQDGPCGHVRVSQPPDPQLGGTEELDDISQESSLEE